MPSLERKNLKLGFKGGNQDERLPLITILGPTAVGKTEIAIQLAERLDGEILSADARLFYRGMDLGTAKPSQAERGRVPHHLIDIADPDNNLSLAIFQQLAHQAIIEIHGRGRRAFLVGGTGQYLRAVIEGWRVPQVKPDPGLRERLEKWAEEIGAHGLHARLAQLDPTAASRIDYRNQRRTVRALEVILRTGRRFSEQLLRGESPYRTLLLGLTRPRPELYARIDARIDEMLAAGFIAEVQGLLMQGYPPNLPAFSAIGYGEMVATLAGKISLEEALAQMKRRTRQFVRRQANWFKADDPAIKWFNVGEDIVDELKTAIREWEDLNVN